ncbi:pyridoxal-phosphate dependent enzyme [Streptomyces sp. NPDC005820]|uniref:pyridoxal-phosphate dependent enzyme n=1 Tax=Streptomyces sp. NPDC005820 TaxID=3157069 RepID=UPI003403F77B
MPDPLVQEYLDRFATLLGPTPVKTVTVDVLGTGRRIHLKLEGHNVTGSIKARTAYGLVRGLAEDGRLRPGAHLLESTSGNLGVALASMARFLGMRFTAVIDPMITAESRKRLVDLDANIVEVDEPDPAGGYLLSRLAKVSELLDRDDRYVWVDQYNSARNPDIHRRMTGPEILDQMVTPPDAVFAAISTGGTFAGLSRCFRENRPQTHMVAVDVNGSVAFGGRPGRRHLPGVGASRRSAFLDDSLVDHLTYTSIEEAVYYCRTLLRESGIHLGGSAGAVVAACVRYLAEHPEIREPLCVCADGGEKYRSTVYSDAWLDTIRGPAAPAASRRAAEVAVSR